MLGLGIAKTTLKRFSNLVNFYVFSPVLDMDVFIIDMSKPLCKGEPIYASTDHLDPITNIDLYGLDYGRLIAMEMDKVTVYGTYNSPGDAARTLDGKLEYKYISRYVNLERPVRIANGTLLYFLMHPDWFSNAAARLVPLTARNTKPVVIVDTLSDTFTAIEFECVRDCLCFLGLSRSSWGSTSFFKRYTNPTKLYKAR